MQKQLLIAALGISIAAIIFFLTPGLARAQSKTIAEPMQVMEVHSQEVDSRVVILEDYLKQYDSPLTKNAKDFVEAADRYELDWKLVAAISGVESTFGKRIPGGYNGWGWGVYGDQALGFESWKDGIYTVSKGLKEDYVSRGLLTPQQMNKRYASSPTWGTKVSYFMNDIDQFAKGHDMSKPQLTQAHFETSTAGTSALLKDKKNLIQLAFNW